SSCPGKSAKRVFAPDVPGIHVLPAYEKKNTWMAGHRRAEATPSFGRLRPAVTVKIPSVRLWRRHHGLGGGLRGAADDDGEQALAPQLLRDLLGVIERHGVDEGVALLDIVDRQLVELVLQQRLREFRG